LRRGIAHEPRGLVRYSVRCLEQHRIRRVLVAARHRLADVAEHRRDGGVSEAKVAVICPKS
jgi:hypothetical protein